MNQGRVSSLDVANELVLGRAGSPLPTAKVVGLVVRVVGQSCGSALTKTTFLIQIGGAAAPAYRALGGASVSASCLGRARCGAPGVHVLRDC